MLTIDDIDPDTSIMEKFLILKTSFAEKFDEVEKSLKLGGPLKE